jgi:hypothetical protein
MSPSNPSLWAAPTGSSQQPASMPESPAQFRSRLLLCNQGLPPVALLPRNKESIIKHHSWEAEHARKEQWGSQMLRGSSCPPEQCLSCWGLTLVLLALSESPRWSKVNEPRVSSEIYNKDSSTDCAANISIKLLPAPEERQQQTQHSVLPPSVSFSSLFSSPSVASLGLSQLLPGE